MMKDEFDGHADDTLEAEGDELAHYGSHLVIWLFHLGSNYHLWEAAQK